MMDLTNKSINFNIYILNNEQLLNNQILYIEYTDILLHSDNSKSVSDMSRNVAVYYIVFLHIMLIIFFCFYSFFYLTSVFPSTTFAKIIHQVTSYQEPINAFSDDKLLDSKSDWKYPLRSQIMYFSSYDDSLEHPKVIWNEKKYFFANWKK